MTQPRRGSRRYPCMARPPRHTPPGTVQHLISRYVNRELRVQTPEQRAALAEQIGRQITRTDWAFLANCWMGSHHHLGTQAGESPSSAFLRPAHSGFATWMNDRQDRSGPLVAGRPRNIEFTQEEDVARLIAYIHNNPVRAGVADDPMDSDWSSHRAYIGEAPVPPWLDVERGLALSGFSATGSSRANFHDFVRSRSGLPRDPYFSGEAGDDVRGETRAVLGQVDVAPRVNGGRGEYAIVARPNVELREALPEPADVVRLVAQATRCTVAQLRGRTRDRRVVAARHLALLIWCGAFGGTRREIAEALDRTPQSCSKLLREHWCGDREVELAQRLAERLGGGLELAPLVRIGG